MKVLDNLRVNKKIERCYKTIAQLEIENEILRVNNEILTNNIKAKDAQIKDLMENHKLLLIANEELQKYTTKLKKYIENL